MLKKLSRYLKKSTNYINLISICILLFLAFVPLKPHGVLKDSLLNNGFSMEAATSHIEYLSNQPHYLGSKYQKRVKNYLIKKLQELKLEVRYQTQNSNRIYPNSLSFAYTENIFATLKSNDKNAKTLVLMAHYDSVSFASPGAGDDASGVAVILEGLRVFLNKHKDKPPKNNIVVLFTDAEEVGLMGAKAFVEKYYDIKNVEMVLNFEARGTAGSSYMLMETQGGNHALLQAFKKANIMYPNSNSLAYSIYKLLPNDTDLTIFRKNANIQGMNFAFIDDYFNYHTQRDNLANLSMDSLAHQALYLMPLLEVFSETDLTTLHSQQDDVYFQIPFYKTVNYPYATTLILSILNLVAFFVIILIGIKNKSLNLKNTAKASTPLFKALTIVLLASLILLKFIYWLHPHYNEILQGFTYNGHSYIILFALMTFMIVHFFYRQVNDKYRLAELIIFPTFIWLVISFACAFYLTGAHFFVIISLIGTLSLGLQVFRKKDLPSLHLLLFAPVILLFSPFFQQIPVALGLKILPFIGLLLALYIASFIPSITIVKNFYIPHKALLIILLVIFYQTERTAAFNAKQQHPDSLYYLQDSDENKSFWLTYDNRLDDWNKAYFEKSTLNSEDLATFQKKYKRKFKIVAEAENKKLNQPKITLTKKRQYADRTIYHFKINSWQNIMQISLYSNTPLTLLNLSINGHPFDIKDTRNIKQNSQLVRIFTRNQSLFEIIMETKPDDKVDLDIFALSPTLLNNKKFNIPPRPKEYMPKPFVYSDSIITKQNIIF